MEPNAERDQRWMAYFLNECDPSERAQIETELRDHPKEAEAARRVCDEIRAWAAEGVEAAPFEVELAYADNPTANGTNIVPFHRRATRRVWPWAVAAMFLLALSQISFTLSLGDSTLSWGQPVPVIVDDSKQLERLQALETTAMETTEFVEALAQQTVALEDELQQTAAELVLTQQVETQTRYRDMERLMQLPVFQPASYKY